ncbi:hypothetical protein MPSEU_000634500 [Mayamaea pseudoterrestris]|nr:hypothetical protein MPSEU_000634500 [Mayamaea pseudoterrestris]
MPAPVSTPIKLPASDVAGSYRIATANGRNGNSSSSSSTKKKKKRPDRLMHAIMVCGILFCVADTLYFVFLLERNVAIKGEDDASASSNRGMPYSVMLALQQGLYSAEHYILATDQLTVRSGSNYSLQEIKNPTSSNKDPLLDLLRDAGIDPASLGNETLDQLPTWNEVTSLYGPEPIIYGLETCQAYREHSDPAEHFIGVAGTFNTGTNLLADLLGKNCFMPERVKKHGAESRGMRWQATYGKHTPIDNETYRLSHKTDTDKNMNADDFFIAACIRDPAVWAPSMCRHSYAMEWSHDNAHCPNLIANEQDVKMDPSMRVGDKIPVTIEYAEITKTHATMLDHYNDYYSDYKKAKFSRVIVRFEDLIFFPKQVVSQVCHCAGGQLEDGPFQYIIESAKKGSAHGKKSQLTGFVDAMIRYGKSQGRWRNMTQHDKRYAAHSLDTQLLQTFHYLRPE